MGRGGFVGAGGLVGGGGCVGCGIAVAGRGRVGVGDSTRVIGIDVNDADVGRGKLVPGTKVNGVTLAGPEGVFVLVSDCVEILMGVFVAAGVAATGRGVVPHSKNPRQ
jgi:hypothetical protein